MRTSLLTLLVLLPLAACKTEPTASTDAPTDTTAASVPLTASATLEPRSGSTVNGTVSFTQEATGVRVVANFAGLTPGEHGFHVHENGDCSAPDGSSAGGHFNPTSALHGHQTDPATGRHQGDLGNLTADENGSATLDLTDNVLMLDGPNSIVGKAVIVHDKPDDYSQPTGNAGGRVACGVITSGMAAGQTTAQDSVQTP
ncbi:MAG: superoxide dismutase family protein [Bacteroidetes bacterium]|nr:superoxide dismutase family protein [Bacteroidota bacterium]